ncbi:Metallo-dependent phosphatase [Myriangium duriaei CBS 260.36]|uniref:Metallo-dependent phosphatase n=1 Tax=Myriangium duriaei CBS 260.36 TaxID=1168546 RepID=A0A9P4J3F4_9PEZI|nr:Metallo-dependent phosphatase [Myriangium duriaei CBS 260.36]
MTRRIVRSFTQIGILIAGVCLVVFFLDNRFRVLPHSLHAALPLHHEVLVITDINLKTCSSVNVFSSCRLDPDIWHRIEKDLYLNRGWTGSAWLHVQRKKEEELKAGEKVVVDLRISRLDPGAGEHGQEHEKWESRPGGIWILRSNKRHDSDSNRVVTGVDLLFGPDAVEPRPGWKLTQTPLLIDAKENLEPRLSIRHGNPKATNADTPVLRVRKDGKFKILQVSDLHLSTGVGACRQAMDEKGEVKGKCEADPRTLQFVEKIRDEEKPDMVVLSGDQVNGDTAPDVQTAMFKFADLFVSEGIPYAAIFGNHDDEGSKGTGLSRESQMSLLSSLPYSLSRFGPDEVDGVGNYYIEVLAGSPSQHSALTLYFMDSHAYSPDEAKFRGYDWIKPNQIAWFKETAKKLKSRNDKYSRIHMNMAFIHIPLPEFAMEDNVYAGGEFREPSTAPGFNSGFYAALKEQGVLAVGCGHDHVNDNCALRPLAKHETRDVQKKPSSKETSVGKATTLSDKMTVAESPRLPSGLGPWMCYAGGSGFGGYAGYGGFHRRVRVWEVDTNAGRITTWTRVECCGADTKKKNNELIIVESGKVIAPVAKE